MARDITSAMAAQLAAAQLTPLILVELQFRSATARNHNGLGDFVWNGNTWTGTGDHISVSVEENTDGAASQAVLMLAGVRSSLVATAYSDEYQGRVAQIWIAALDASGAMVLDPVSILYGIMDTIADADDGDSATFALTVQTQMLDQRFARSWRLTDAHQKELFPGDKGLEFMAGLAQKVLKWGAS